MHICLECVTQKANSLTHTRTRQFMTGTQWNDTQETERKKTGVCLRIGRWFYTLQVEINWALISNSMGWLMVENANMASAQKLNTREREKNKQIDFRRTIATTITRRMRIEWIEDEIQRWSTAIRCASSKTIALFRLFSASFAIAFFCSSNTTNHSFLRIRNWTWLSAQHTHTREDEDRTIEFHADHFFFLSGSSLRILLNRSSWRILLLLRTAAALNCASFFPHVVARRFACKKIKPKHFVSRISQNCIIGFVCVSQPFQRRIHPFSLYLSSEFRFLLLRVSLYAKATRQMLNIWHEHGLMCYVPICLPWICAFVRWAFCMNKHACNVPWTPSSMLPVVIMRYPNGEHSALAHMERKMRV